MKKNIFNTDNFNWWIGVVEDRMDPEKLGRCKVRIFGYHPEFKEDLTTEDLPWAWPIQPITSAGISGKGSTPLGPLPGTWVIGFFLDGEDMQQPTFFGVISSMVSGETYEPEPEPETTNNPNIDILRTEDGKPVLDSSGNPIQTGKPVKEGWELGSTSERFESGGRGPGTINDYLGKASGDYGGASYGTYQFASYLPKINKNGKHRPDAKSSPLMSYLRSSKYGDNFKNLTPATPEFDSTWKKLASQDPAGFKADQHDYIKANYYDVMVNNLKRNGFDASKYGPGVQDLIWSTAVQLGPANTSVFTQPLANKSTLNDKDVVNLVSEYKKSRVNILFRSSSAEIRTSVKNRYESEQKTLLTLC